MNQSADIYMQCRNKDGMLGNFLKDGDKEISPCFPDFLELYSWMKQNGWDVGHAYRAYKVENKS